MGREVGRLGPTRPVVKQGIMVLNLTKEIQPGRRLNTENIRSVYNHVLVRLGWAVSILNSIPDVLKGTTPNIFLKNLFLLEEYLFRNIFPLTVARLVACCNRQHYEDFLVSMLPFTSKLVMLLRRSIEFVGSYTLTAWLPAWLLINYVFCTFMGARKYSLTGNLNKQTCCGSFRKRPLVLTKEIAGFSRMF